MLSDNQRRFICRIAFLAGCVLPTLSVVYWIFHRPTAADWARNIKAELGVVAVIDSIETPWPGITILRGVKLHDPETGKLFEATEVGIEMTERENRVIVNQNLSLTSSGLIKLVQLINENPIRRHVADRSWQLYFNGLTTIYDKNSALQFDQPLTQTVTFEQMHVELKPLHDRTELHLRFQLVDAPKELDPGQIPFPNPIIEAHLARSHPYSDGYSDLLVKLDTKGVSLPCWLMGDLVPDVQELGTESKFEGSLAFVPRAGSPLGWVRGRFTQVDRKKYFGGGSFEAIELACEIDGTVKKWSANLIDNENRTPIPFSQPFSVGHAIIAAQQDHYNMSSTLHR